MSARRDELAEGATHYAVEHGLIGLSLRPLARSLGTSDRMLLYHFRDKDDLVATVLQIANDRSIAGIGALPPSPATCGPPASLRRRRDGARPWSTPPSWASSSTSSSTTAPPAGVPPRSW